MTDLSEFLLARIAEDEEVVGHALRAIDNDRTAYAAELARRTGPLSTTTSSSHCGQDMGPRGTVEATPGRALAECAAKRRIVTEIHHRAGDSSRNEWLMDWQKDACEGCGWSGPCDDYVVEHINDCPTLRLLALPYSDHRDYDATWAEL